MSVGAVATDQRTGLAYPQARLVAAAAGSRRWQFVGSITYMCFTCGDLIVKPWEVLFVDDTPGREWASYIAPLKPPRTMTTHHDWHMAADG